MRDDIRQVAEFLRASLDSEIKVTLGDAIREPLFARLGNPILYEQGDTNPVDCSLTDFDQVGLVWCFFEQENGLPSSPFPVLNAGKNKIRDDEKVYKTPVHIVRNGNEYLMDGLAGYDAEEWFHNVNIRPQRSVKLSQFDVGLLRPTSPPSGELIMSPATFHLNGTAYPLGVLRTSDLISAYEPATAGKAVIVKVELDPTDGTFTYDIGAEFDYDENSDSPSHIDYVSNAVYTKTVNSARFHLGWVRVYNGTTQLLQSAIYYAQELMNKGASVDSVFGRTGAVIAIAGDYGSDEITNDSSVAGATVSDALDALDGASGGGAGSIVAWLESDIQGEISSATMPISFTAYYNLDDDYLDTVTDDTEVLLAGVNKRYIVEMLCDATPTLSGNTATFDLTLTLKTSSDSTRQTFNLTSSIHLGDTEGNGARMVQFQPIHIDTFYAGDYFEVELAEQVGDTYVGFLYLKLHEFAGTGGGSEPI